MPKLMAVETCDTCKSGGARKKTNGSTTIVERTAENGSMSFLEGLSTEAGRMVGSLTTTVGCREGALVIMEGWPSLGLYILRKGRLKLFTTQSDGRSLVLRVLRPGEALGLSTIIVGADHEMSAEALQPCVLDFISRDDFMKVVGMHSDVRLAVARQLSRDYLMAFSLIRSIGHGGSVSQRVARFLLEWTSNGHSAQPEGLGGPVLPSHEEIAQSVGSSRETVTRVLGRLKKHRVLERDHSRLVLNKSVLEQMAGV